MLDSLSSRAIEAMSPAKHELYALALGVSGRVSAAEGVLQNAVHAAFEKAIAGAEGDFVQSVKASLAVGMKPGAVATAELPSDPMPADTWARITAAIQIQAAKVAKSTPRAL